MSLATLSTQCMLRGDSGTDISMTQLTASRGSFSATLTMRSGSGIRAVEVAHREQPSTCRFKISAPLFPTISFVISEKLLKFRMIYQGTTVPVECHPEDGQLSCQAHFRALRARFTLRPRVMSIVLTPTLITASSGYRGFANGIFARIHSWLPAALVRSCSRTVQVFAMWRFVSLEAV
jgi:hypothetical protein